MKTILYFCCYLTFNMTFRYILTILITLLSNTIVFGQGLMFQRDNTVEIGHTTYDVFDGRSCVLKDQFTICFDIEIYNYHTVGNILRVSDGIDSTNDYLFYYSYCDDTFGYFKFNIEIKENRVPDMVSL